VDTNKKRHVLNTMILIAAALLVVLILGKGLMLNPRKIPSALIDKPAKNFVAETLQGHVESGITPDTKEFSLETFKNKPVVLNFWASWCVSCREEARDFEAFWQKYKDRGLIIAGVAIQDEKSAAMKFAQYFGKTYILGLDLTGNAALDYGVSGVPETFLIDRQGIIRYKEAGPMTLKTLEEKIHLIL
jgi:cytochrome c biogenesis protein CcmG/thiol:disulfide interchange protein DsbE